VRGLQNELHALVARREAEPLIEAVGVRAGFVGGELEPCDQPENAGQIGAFGMAQAERPGVDVECQQ